MYEVATATTQWPLTCKRCGRKTRAAIFLPPNAEITCLNCSGDLNAPIVERIDSRACKI